MVILTQPVVSTARNGVGTFIHQCKRLEFHYCDWSGSSYGMKTFLQQSLAPLAAHSPQITHHISPRPNKHPIIRATYVNGAEKVVCVRNLASAEIAQRVNLLRNSSGEKNRRLVGGRFVTSRNESVRGVWSAIHAARLDAEAGRDVWAWKGRGGKKQAALRDGRTTGVVQEARLGALP